MIPTSFVARKPAMFNWFRKKAYPFVELTDEAMSEIWGGDPVSAAVSIGGSLISGLIGSHASQQAANTQANAANNATNAQLQMFNTVNQQQAPWRQAGQNALGSISGGFGLGPSSVGVDSGYFNHKFN